MLTDDMDRCFITRRSDHIERHHIFGGALRNKSEKYGFVVPLTAEIHPNGAFFNSQKYDRREVDEVLKMACQMYYEEHIGTREEFLQEFGRNYL